MPNVEIEQTIFKETQGLSANALIVFLRKWVLPDLLMDDSEKDQAWELARSIKRDKNLSSILNQGRRGIWITSPRDRN